MPLEEVSREEKRKQPCRRVDSRVFSKLIFPTENNVEMNEHFKRD